MDLRRNRTEKRPPSDTTVLLSSRAPIDHLPWAYCGSALVRSVEVRGTEYRCEKCEGKLADLLKLVQHTQQHYFALAHRLMPICTTTSHTPGCQPGSIRFLGQVRHTIGRRQETTRGREPPTASSSLVAGLATRSKAQRRGDIHTPCKRHISTEPVQKCPRSP